MSFDLSRVRFDARKNFLGVIMQQGRVQLDADWNEWVAQLSRRIQAGTLDSLGHAVVPRETPDAFLIAAKDGKLTIGAGRIYVDGLLAENHGAKPDTWNRHLAEEVCTQPTPFLAQPYLWFNDADAQDSPASIFDRPKLENGHAYLVYVDVWQRDVTHLQYPCLVDPAVGVDTTGRMQTIWQVKLLPVTPGVVTRATKEEDIPGWLAATRPSAGRLSTSSGDSPRRPEPCEVSPQAGYRGPENQLYRVEIHRGGRIGRAGLLRRGEAPGGATFKWSRDNATVATRVTHITQQGCKLKVETVGRDDVLRFKNGDWVEITDDRHELHSLPGELRRISVDGGVDDVANILTLDAALPDGAFPVSDLAGMLDPRWHTRVRRWDAGEIAVPPAGTRLFLENGIVVEFSLASDAEEAEGEFRTGDYWVFAARSADASIEKLDQAPPLGIHHHYAPLAVVTTPPDTAHDLRTHWPPRCEGEGCACVVCVKPETHNHGSATIEHAIARLKDAGGTICLCPGTYRIGGTLKLDNARSVRLRGQGWRTILQGTQPGTVVAVSGGTGIALENLTIVGSVGGGGAAAVAPASPVTVRSEAERPKPAAPLRPVAIVSASNVVDLLLDHVNIVGVATAGATSAALDLSGYVVGGTVSDCVLVASRGVVCGSAERAYLLTAELRATRNVLWCRERGISFEGVSLHLGDSRVTENLVLGCSQDAITATGGVPSGSQFTISDNVIHVAGTGVRAGVDGLRVKDNEITGSGEGPGDGIVLERGLDPVAIDHAQIIGNRILHVGGSGVVIRHRVATGMIKQNTIADVGLAGLAMEKGGSAAVLMVEDNHFGNLGRLVDQTETGLAGLHFIAVDRLDVINNVVLGVAYASKKAPAVVALLGSSVGDARVAGNRFAFVGPAQISGFAEAIRLVGSTGHVAIDGNTISRAAEGEDASVQATWRAVCVGAGPTNEDADLTHVTSQQVQLQVVDRAFLVTATQLRTFGVTAPEVSIRGNRMMARMTRTQLVWVDGASWCLFADNYCRTTCRPAGTSAAAIVFTAVPSAAPAPAASAARAAEIEYPQGDVALVHLDADAVNASSNRLVTDAGTTLRIHAAGDGERRAAVVLGNLSTGMIYVNGTALGSRATDLNVIGV